MGRSRITLSAILAIITSGDLMWSHDVAADTHQAKTPSATEILSAMAKAYSAAATYADHGLVTTAFTGRPKFRKKGPLRNRVRA
jgi:hypothetical protein